MVVVASVAQEKKTEDSRTTVGQQGRKQNGEVVQ